MSNVRLSSLVKTATSTNTRTLKGKYVIVVLIFSLTGIVAKKDLIPNRVNVKIPNTYVFSCKYTKEKKHKSSG